MLRDDMAEVHNYRDAERAFAPLNRQLMLTEPLEDCPDMLQVRGPQVFVHENIIEENKDEVSNEITQHIVHKCLEGR
jgi:hypothetical protein